MVSTLVIALVGCGSPTSLPGPPPQPVHGKVLFQGKPAAGFRIAFHPLSEQQGPRFAPSALVDENGEFRLQSYRANDGAPTGDYAVTFTWPQALPSDDPDDAPRMVDRLKGRFCDPRTSRFQVSIHEGENQLEPFLLP